AVNYGHRTQPTRLDFRGTVLLPDARGDATVQAQPGAVSIRARFRGLPAPNRYGAGYMTYVLWAVSPQGHAERLGELLTNHSDDAKLDVTTTLQVFGLLVTAEPYFAVSKPSAVVVIENVVRPDTVGSTQPITATYELLPRDENVTIEAAPTIPQAGAKVS